MGSTACSSPSNVLAAESSTADGECVLVDFEFTGLFFPGVDFAMLHPLLADTPGAQASIEALVGEADIEVPFMLNPTANPGSANWRC